jgi:hypothetical protein
MNNSKTLAAGTVLMAQFIYGDAPPMRSFDGYSPEWDGLSVLEREKRKNAVRVAVSCTLRRFTQTTALLLTTALTVCVPAFAQTVSVDLHAQTGQIITGAEFGLATTMGDLNHDYLPYGDPAFQQVANQYSTSLLRHNWELNTMMDIIFPSRGAAASPDFQTIDNFLSQQGKLLDFFNNQTGSQVVTLGFPSWLDISNPSDQALYASMVKLVAQHFIDMAEPVRYYELVNEPDGRYSVQDMANTFNVVAQMLTQTFGPTYKMGGLTETYPKADDLQQFFQISGPNIGFVSWHQYVTNGSDGKGDQQVVNDSLSGGLGGAQLVRRLMQAAGIPDSVPMFLGEYNVDGANFDDPNNGNMVGAVAAAAVTYGMIEANDNMSMAALWCVENGSAYSAYGGQGNYRIDPVGAVLSYLAQYMPGHIVQTTMPGNAQGLIGYTTVDNAGGFSTALIDTNLSQGYTVNLSINGAPQGGISRVEISNANPAGLKTPVPDLTDVSVPAGGVVIVTNELPHVGVTTQAAASTSFIFTPAQAAELADLQQQATAGEQQNAALQAVVQSMPATALPAAAVAPVAASPASQAPASVPSPAGVQAPAAVPLSPSDQAALEQRIDTRLARFGLTATLSPLATSSAPATPAESGAPTPPVAVPAPALPAVAAPAVPSLTAPMAVAMPSTIAAPALPPAEDAGMTPAQAAQLTTAQQQANTIAAELAAAQAQLAAEQQQLTDLSAGVPAQ